ncbi:MAG: ABC transporter ATP-binding protein [candidate division Zixibacteria bacterium]|nr:ABC transporter ATP-binding protein [candidate division Zixibacteria bacterium]
MRVVLRDICKGFGPVQAIDGISLAFEPGEIHALLGENGAGKTTLMNILYGLYQPDSGTIEIGGAARRIRSPGDAIALGVGMIHQHFTLIPVMTVAENLILGESRADRWHLDRRHASDEIAAFSQHHRLPVDPDVPVWQLPVGTQQRVEILKALRRGAQTLILDEPTAVLTPQEVEELFTVLRGFRESGRAVVFISHKLHEVMTISDRVTVLRHGRVAGTTQTECTDPASLTRLMIGREVDTDWVRPPFTPGSVCLSVNDLVVRNDRDRDAVRGVSLQVHRGEILGIAGVDGNGQGELAETLTGLRRSVSGKIRIRDRDITDASIAEIAEQGIAHIPQDRQKTGLVSGFSVEENLMLDAGMLRRRSRNGLLDLVAIRAETERLMETYDIRARDSRQAVSALSGGNQQKVVLARALSRRPDVLIAFNPTRGVDVNATDEIHRRLLEHRAAGAAILLISTELEEIYRLSDRIAVMLDGRIVGIVEAGTPRQEVGRLMAGAV